MKQKFFAFGLSVVLLLAQNAFIFSQNAVVKQTSNDDVIGLFDDPDVIAVVQIKKILAETAPMLLGSHPETIEKIKTAMKTVEGDLGVDPYSLDKVYFGMNMGKSADSFLIVLKTSGSASETVEKMFQAQVVKSKFAAEINPLKNRIDKLERAIRPFKENIIPMSQPNEDDKRRIETFETNLGKLKVFEAQKTAFDKLKTDTAELKKAFAEYQTFLKNVYNLDDIPRSLEAIKKDADAINGNDPQRAAKIAAADKAVAPLEKEFADKRMQMDATAGAKNQSGFSMIGFPETLEGISGADQSEFNLSDLQSSVSERIRNLKAFNELLLKKPVEPGGLLMKKDSEDTFVTYPISETSTRKDETVGGKKIVAITTIKNFPKTNFSSSTSVTNNVLVFDEQTLIIGGRNSLIEAVKPKTADANRLAKNMIARSPDALISFGFNFRNMDMSELTKTLGEQKKAWQIVGSLDSGGNDISLSAAFERSDAPINVQPKKPGESMIPKTPEIPGGGEVKDLVESMFKTIIGVEAKFTVRFDKQKTVGFVETAPKFLEKILKR